MLIIHQNKGVSKQPFYCTKPVIITSFSKSNQTITNLQRWYSQSEAAMELLKIKQCFTLIIIFQKCRPPLSSLVKLKTLCSSLLVLHSFHLAYLCPESFWHDPNSKPHYPAPSLSLYHNLIICFERGTAHFSKHLSTKINPKSNAVSTLNIVSYGCDLFLPNFF